MAKLTINLDIDFTPFEKAMERLADVIKTMAEEMAAQLALSMRRKYYTEKELVTVVLPILRQERRAADGHDYQLFKELDREITLIVFALNGCPDERKQQARRALKTEFGYDIVESLAKKAKEMKLWIP